MKGLTCKMLNDMSDGTIMSNCYLAENYSWRFGGRLYDLRQAGVVFKKTQGEGHIEYFEVIYIPQNVLYKNRTSIRVIKLSLLDRIYNFITK